VIQPAARPRIARQESPPPLSGRDGYLGAREYLRRDFGCRCAYCMVHEHQVGGPESFCIDHFRPRSKGGAGNTYPNLHWACGGCNRAKGDLWPTPDEEGRGIRFADPCREQDYGVHFVEDEHARLEPRTACGEYHVAALRLNRASRVRLRSGRNGLTDRLAQAEALIAHLRAQPVSELKRQAVAHIEREVELIREGLGLAIPFVPPYPTTVATE